MYYYQDNGILQSKDTLRFYLEDPKWKGKIVSANPEGNNDQLQKFAKNLHELIPDKLLYFPAPSIKIWYSGCYWTLSSFRKNLGSLPQVAKYVSNTLSRDILVLPTLVSDLRITAGAILVKQS